MTTIFHWNDNPATNINQFLIEYGNSSCIPCPSQSPSVTRTPSVSISPSVSLSSNPNPSFSSTAPSSQTQTVSPTRKKSSSPSTTNKEQTEVRRPCVDCEVEPVSYTFDSKTANKEIVIPFRYGNTLAGQMVISPNTFPPGCTVYVNESIVSEDIQLDNSNNDGHHCSDSDPGTIVPAVSYCRHIENVSLRLWSCSRI
eukprot:TRINITY_DN6967_c0_g1_i1.p1 TRINITY_DN6967_c0_g1~~TRINITY_DN6967_c0_g1_i1.p1  ORF type:complete len:198 (-),score=21.54 TRINITY_DN6967_c0_g1_i1:138-731(-)